MKQVENNEIDRLLRGLARRRRSGSIDQSSSESGSRDLTAETSLHLDADELSAYAENALPAATRTRYTTHLVDCDDCRKIVIQLTVAAGLPARDRVAGHETALSTWSEKLAALLSPRRLRYAMPALVLFAIMVVGFFALRQKKEASFVAQNQGSENSRVAVTQVENKQSGTASSQSESQTAGNEEQAANKKRSQATPEKKSGSTDSAATSTGATASPTSAPARDKEPSRNETAAVAKPSYAPEAAPPPKPADEAAQAKKAAKAEDEKREEKDATARNKEADKSRAFGGVATQNVPASRRATPAYPQGGKAKTRATDAQAAGAGAAGERTDDQTEMRTVGGRRFRRQNGAWVDIAYDSSGATTNVARGSEQYRALIADEPGIRTIAEQLSGQVIVVWKGHAYRIH